VHSFFPISFNAREKESWHVHALFHDKSCVQYFQQALAEPDPTPAQELDPILEPFSTQGSIATTDYLDLVLPSDEEIIEALTRPKRY
jgi:hypothetical protein